jgi:hypothetical protein
MLHTWRYVNMIWRLCPVIPSSTCIIKKIVQFLNNLADVWNQVLFETPVGDLRSESVGLWTSSIFRNSIDWGLLLALSQEPNIVCISLDVSEGGNR